METCSPAMIPLGLSFTYGLDRWKRESIYVLDNANANQHENFCGRRKFWSEKQNKLDQIISCTGHAHHTDHSYGARWRFHA